MSDPLRERWRNLDSRRADAVLAGILAVLLVAVLLTAEEREGPLALNLLAGLAIIGVLIERRRHPLLVAALVSAGALGMNLALTSPIDVPALTFALMVASYTVGAHVPGRQAWLGLAMASGTILAICLIETPGDILFPFIFFGVAPWAVGRILKSQTELTRTLAEQEARIRHLREVDEAAAINRERNRIARELHDVLAHNLSVMVIQASGARRSLDRDPRVAIDAAELIGRTAGRRWWSCARSSARFTAARARCSRAPWGSPTCHGSSIVRGTRA